LSKCEF
jgi:hypothetical protein